MQYRTLVQIERVADVQRDADPDRGMSQQERLECWAMTLERHSGPLRSIEAVEFGSRRERDAKAADDSPLSVAFENAALRAAELRGDTIGDAVAFFGLSHDELHYILCNCHHGHTLSPAVAASRVRAAARRARMLAPFTVETAVAGTSALAAIGLALAVL